jgi:hypothetical protein
MAFSPAQQASTAAVPNLINYSGNLVLPSGEGVSTKTVGVIFAIYWQQDGGAPLWLETQNVTPDYTGHYSVLLGSTRTEGIPPDLFNTQEQRWAWCAGAGTGGATQSVTRERPLRDESR